MKHSTTGIVAALILLGVVASVGYWQVQHGSGRTQATSPANVATAEPRHGSVAPVAIDTVRPLSTAALQTLDGRAFVDTLPDLERRARAAEPGVARLLFERLRECAGFRPSSDEDLREPIDDEYQRRLEQERRIREAHPDEPVVPPGFPTAEEARDHALQHAFDLRDRCSALDARQVGGRLEWLQLALQQRDRQALLGVTTPGELGMTGAELVRNADRVLELRRIAQQELDRLALGGDTEAMAREAYARTSDATLWPRDPVQAWAWAWLQRRIDGGEDVRGMEPLMQRLAGELSPEQLAQARSQGEALLGRCCGKTGP